MGDIYHAGEVYGSSVSIDDTKTSDKSTWSSQKINNTKADQTAIATVENGTTASRAYAIGENFMKDGAFCTAIAAIAQGATFTLNTNYTAGTVGAMMEGVQSRLDDMGVINTYNLVTNSTAASQGSECNLMTPVELQPGIYDINVNFRKTSLPSDSFIVIYIGNTNELMMDVCTSYSVKITSTSTLYIKLNNNGSTAKTFTANNRFDKVQVIKRNK